MRYLRFLNQVLLICGVAGFVGIGAQYLRADTGGGAGGGGGGGAFGDPTATWGKKKTQPEKTKKKVNKKKTSPSKKKVRKAVKPRKRPETGGDLPRLTAPAIAPRLPRYVGNEIVALFALGTALKVGWSTFLVAMAAFHAGHIV